LITLDFTQSRCPIPLVQTKLHLKAAKSGDTFCLILSDPGSLSDVPKLLKKLGHQVKVLDSSDENIYKYIVSLNPKETIK